MSSRLMRVRVFVISIDSSVSALGWSCCYVFAAWFLLKMSAGTMLITSTATVCEHYVSCVIV